LTSRSASDRPRVLVIDDEEPLRRLMARVLERAGYEPLTAAGGGEGVRLFRAHAQEIDLVLLDVILPGQGAAEILPLLLDERPDLRVILTSGDALHSDLRSRLEAIDGRFLAKPFAPPALLRLLEDDSDAGKVRSGRSPAPAGRGLAGERA